MNPPPPVLPARTPSRLAAFALLALLSLNLSPAARCAERPDEMDAETARILESDTIAPNDPNAKETAADLPPATDPIDLRLDWTQTRFKTGRDAYSLNAFQNFGFETPSNPRYQENIAYINPGMLRYHYSGVMADSKKSSRGWVDYEARTWDFEKIKKVTAVWPRGPAVMITIPKWPDYMSSGPERLLDEANYEAYAALCADLVRILNIELKLGVKKWEPMNERELSYIRALKKAGKKTQYSKVVALFNLCAKKMKAVDPTIQVGGPAVSSAAWLSVVNTFIKGTKDNLDFFTCHLYASNNVNASDERIFNSAINFGARLAKVREILKAEIPSRHVDVSLDEFNINYTFKTADKRMTNHKGAIFDALVMISVAANGGNSTCAWNDADYVYGKMTRKFELRPAAHLYHLMNDYFVGDVASSHSSDEKRIVPFAVRDARTGSRSLMLINRSAAPQTVKIAAKGAPLATGPLKRHEISAAGYVIKSIAAEEMETGVTVPEFSITVLTVGE